MEGGPPRFIPGFTCPALLGIPLSGPRSFGYGALPLFRPASQPVPLDRGFLTRPRRSSDGTEGPTTPRAATPGGLHAHGFRLLRFRSPLLAQSRLISFPPGTLMFQFPGLPPPSLFDSARGCWARPQQGSPIRRSAGRRVLAPHRGLSQLATSFVGFLCQGIHRVPLISSSNKSC